MISWVRMLQYDRNQRIMLCNNVLRRFASIEAVSGFPIPRIANVLEYMVWRFLENLRILLFNSVLRLLASISAVPIKSKPLESSTVQGWRFLAFAHKAVINGYCWFKYFEITAVFRVRTIKYNKNQQISLFKGILKRLACISFKWHILEYSGNQHILLFNSNMRRSA